jgi:hypothetical protein
VSLETSRFQLFSTLKTARLRWEDACNQWHDPVRQNLENDFWNHVEPTVKAAMSALDRLAQVMAKLKTECSSTRSFFHDE